MSSQSIDMTPLKMEDAPGFKSGRRRSSSFDDNSVSTIEVTEDVMTPSTSMRAADDVNEPSSNGNLPVMTPPTQAANIKRSRKDITLDESVLHGHATKRGPSQGISHNPSPRKRESSSSSSRLHRSTRRATTNASASASASASGPSAGNAAGPAHSHSHVHASMPKRKKKSILQAYPMHKNASDASRNIIVQLKSLYQTRIKPIEQKFHLYQYCLPTNAEIRDAEFDAKPMVLLLGQYSTGKSTFVRHLVGGDYPSMHIGPEPTTDRFTALIHGNDESDDDEEEHELEHEHEHEHGSVLQPYDQDYDYASTMNATDATDDEMSFITQATNPRNVLTKRWKMDGVNKSSGYILKGNSLTVMPELPFSSLATFGSGFLSHFVGSITPAPLLEHVTLIDTPGVLSGEKQRLSRSYDFAKASRWFADRSDLILLLFDAHKLDISDELKEVIETIRPHNDDKIRCILNKADGVTREQLVRVYGSLMWSMGKIFQSPEVVRVYTGSYWDEPLVHDDFEGMFESDEWLLIHELVNLPKSCAERKVNEIVKRIRIIKVHVCILTTLKSQMPRWFGKKKVQETLIENLEEIFEFVRIEYQLSAGDFPDVNEFARCLREVEDFSTFEMADKKTLRQLDDLILTHIPNIMKGTSGITDPFSPKSKNKSARKKANLKFKQRELSIPTASIPTKGIKESKESLAEKPALVHQHPQSSFSFFGLFLLTLILGYISLYVFVQQDLHNDIGLPDVVLDHFAMVSSLIEDSKQFLEKNVYDSREFNVA